MGGRKGACGDGGAVAREGQRRPGLEEQIGHAQGLTQDLQKSRSEMMMDGSLVCIDVLAVNGDEKLPRIIDKY